MRQLKINSILALLVTATFVTSGFTPSAWAQPAAPVAASSADEAAVFNAIDKQADELFNEFQKAHPHAEITVLKHAKRAAVYRIKQLGAVTDILKASGHAPATALIAAEILTTFIIAPIAASMGHPAIAGVALTVPWGLVAGFGVFYYQSIKQRYKIARSLGLYSLRSLDRVRELVVGYDLKHRVSSVVYRSLSESLLTDLGSTEFEVLRKSVDHETTKMPAITLPELEKFVKSIPEGVSYLQQIYLQRLDAPLYSTLLLRFISENETMTGQLVELVASRMPEVSMAVERSVSLRGHLISVGDVRMKVERETKLALKNRAALKKQVKSGELSKEDAAKLKVHFKEEIARFGDLRKELITHEYTVLLRAKLSLAEGQQVDSLQMRSELASELSELSLRARSEVIPIAATRGHLTAEASKVARQSVNAINRQMRTCSSVF